MVIVWITVSWRRPWRTNFIWRWHWRAHQYRHTWYEINTWWQCLLLGTEQKQRRFQFVHAVRLIFNKW